jgi:transposase
MERLVAQNAALAAQNEAVRRENTVLVAQNQTIRRENAELSARVAELERRLGLNSSTSGKPPSSDGLAKKPPRTRSLRLRSNKPAGGQMGHPGQTLRAVDNPDHIIDHIPTRCEGCGAALAATPGTDYDARQVFDLGRKAHLRKNAR